VGVEVPEEQNRDLTMQDQSIPDLQDHPRYQPDDITRSLPHAVGPEKAVLSWMLSEPATFIAAAVEKRLTPEHFYLPANALLFSALVARFDGGKTVELVALMQHLLDNGLLDRVGGPSTLADLMTYATAPGSFDHQVAILREKRMLRSLIRLSNEAITGAFDAPEFAADLLDEVETRLMAIREDDRACDNMTEAKDGIRRVMAEIESYSAGYERQRGIATGFLQIDNMTGGMMPGGMFVIAARPSMGKTAIMLNIVENVAVDQGRKVLVFSAEMTTHQLLQRVTYSRARFDGGKIKRKETLTKHDLLTLRNASIEIASATITVDDTSGITVSELRAKTRRVMRSRKLDLIAVDYLQLMRSKSKQATNSREREIGEISAGLKGLAKELGVPVIVLAQLNRESEKRAGKAKGIPRMSDLRESGNIEQDADFVGLLHRDAYYAESPEDKAAKAGVARLIVAKNRDGETGEVPLTFIDTYARFESGPPARDDRDEPFQKSRYQD